jgi:hypothetical protein
MPSTAERSLLLAPDAVARAAAPFAPDAAARWMLRQPRAVRRSFVEEVIGREDEELHRQVWMLRQPRQVRERFVAEVLLRQDPVPRESVWMLRQDDAVCRSYARFVLLGEDGYAAGGS